MKKQNLRIFHWLLKRTPNYYYTIAKDRFSVRSDFVYSFLSFCPFVCRLSSDKKLLFFLNSSIACNLTEAVVGRCSIVCMNFQLNFKRRHLKSVCWSVIKLVDASGIFGCWYPDAWRGFKVFREDDGLNIYNITGPIFTKRGRIMYLAVLVHSTDLDARWIRKTLKLTAWLELQLGGINYAETEQLAGNLM